jgi:hypothetical protein
MSTDQEPGGTSPSTNGHRAAQPTETSAPESSPTDGGAEAVLRIAWARGLGIRDDAIGAPGSRTVVVVPDSAESISYLSLFGASVFVGPAWAAEVAMRYSDEELGSERALMTIAKDHGAHKASAETILYIDEYLPLPFAHPSTAPLISRERDAVVKLEDKCPPDDVQAAELSRRTAWFTQLDGFLEPVACAAYSEWQGVVANLTALTAPGHRQQGYARTVSAFATNSALDQGLIPQWRAHRTNANAWHLAEALGYRTIGILATVALDQVQGHPDIEALLRRGPTLPHEPARQEEQEPPSAGGAPSHPSTPPDPGLSAQGDRD